MDTSGSVPAVGDHTTDTDPTIDDPTDRVSPASMSVRWYERPWRMLYKPVLTRQSSPNGGAPTYSYELRRLK